MPRRFLTCGFLFSDDPYYCGLRARVPNFVAKANTKTNGTITEKKMSFFGKKDSNKSKEKEKEKEKEKDKDKESKESTPPKQRPSYAQMPHPASFSTLYQLHQMQNGMMDTMSRRGTFQRHNSQPVPVHPHYNMWHAKSYESGIGNILKNFRKLMKILKFFTFLDTELESPYPIYSGRLPTQARGYVPIVPRQKVFVGDWE